MDEHPLLELAGERLHLAFFELDDAIDESEEGVVSTALDVLAGMELRAALADEDVSLHGDLVTIDLHAEALRDGIASETG